MKILDLLDTNLDEAKRVQTIKHQDVDQNREDIGLTSEQAATQLSKYGRNELQQKKQISPFKIFFNQYKDIMTIILIICTCVSLMMGEYVEAIAIGIIVFMNGILGFIQEYRTEKTLEALKNMASPMAHVYRNGVLTQVPSNELVPNDVVYLKAGDKIPADGVLIESTGLACDESLLTGESVPVKKTHASFLEIDIQDEHCMVFMGATVTLGHCMFSVKSTGMNTKMGSIAQMIQEVKEEPTPLQRRLAKLSKAIAIGCLVICAVVTATGILRGEPFMQMLITGVSLAVAAVPEGLPAIVTISLALSVSRMVKRYALVRRLHAVETLGCATVICSDKTGTLTQNRMTATHMITFDGMEKCDKLNSKSETVAMILKAITLCNNSEILSAGSFGDQTELCLLQLADKYKLSRHALAKEYRRIDEQPFDSTRKRMSVVVQHGNEQYMFIKGGVDILLDRCISYQHKNGISDITYSVRQHIENSHNTMADDALRVICIAYKKLTPLTDSRTEEGLTFLGLIGMIDPPRKEARPAVLSCHKAGIKTVMITGDHKKTAVAIAKDIGIYHNGDLVLTGLEIDSMGYDELCKLVVKTTVFARVSPNHKLLIVKALKRHGNIVAMTGDGVNDAPAIKEADIGVSMGRGGTDVTREASEIILLDDNFATLVNAVDEGRSIYSNIRKFIRYLLACNIGEVLTMFLGMLMGMPVIFLPIQILLVNLVTDGLPAIALGLEPSDKRAMSVPPRKPGESVFSNGLATKIIVRGVLIGLTTLFSFVTLFRMSGDVAVARSGALFALIFAQLIHVFECKSEEKGLFSIPYFNNMKLIGATLLSLITLIAVIYLPVLQMIFSTVALSSVQVMTVVGLCMITPIIIGVCRK